MQDEKGGLEVWDKATEGWIAAPLIPGAYLVNLGDLMARWTNDRYRSTLHRVINVSGADRYSIPFFFAGNPDHEVVSLIEGEMPLYPPTTVEGHLRERYQQSYG
jgi:isopenicillin N synthase-like dioxygenase